jgi:hypothetical protein
MGLERLVGAPRWEWRIAVGLSAAARGIYGEANGEVERALVVSDTPDYKKLTPSRGEGGKNFSPRPAFPHDCSKRPDMIGSGEIPQ